MKAQWVSRTVHKRKINNKFEKRKIRITQVYQSNGNNYKKTTHRLMAQEL
jgi:hypothetical protein